MASQPSSAKRVAAHRLRLRALGLRPVQIWIPDRRHPTFAQEARRQALAVAASEQDAGDQTFIAAISADARA